MVSITLFLMRSAIVSFESSHPNYRTVGIWLSWQESGDEGHREPCVGVQRTQTIASVLLLTSLLTLESNACVYSPFSIFGPSQQLQINHYSFCPFPRATVTFWISLGFLVGSMINHIVNTVFKNLCVISMKEHKLSRFLAIGMDALAMNWVKKNNW